MPNEVYFDVEINRDIESDFENVPNYFISKYLEFLNSPSDNSEKLDIFIEKSGDIFSESLPIFIEGNVLGIAVVDKFGYLISSTKEFILDESEKNIDFEYVSKSLFSSSSCFDPLTSMIYVPSSIINIWNWPRDFSEYKKVQDSVIIFTERLSKYGSISKICYKLGLKDSHHRLINSVILKGTIKLAAKHIGISHQRARAIVSEALYMTNNSNIQQLITMIYLNALGINKKENVKLSKFLCESWGITERQANLAILIADGYSRTAAAKFLNLSQAVVKKEMSALFRDLGINSAAELSVHLGSLRFQTKFENSKRVFGEVCNNNDEPIQLEYDAHGRQIAYSDYGPADGFPVFFIHSSMTSRFVPRAVRRSLQNRGFRVISIDRPGFGLTSKSNWNQFEQAARDFCLIQDRLRAKPALALARGGAQFLLALARERHDALGGVVVVNPDPASVKSDKRLGPLGAVKEYFLRSPFMISAFAKITAKYLSPERVKYWMKKSFEFSESDSKALFSHEICEDYWECVKSFSAGYIDGYIAEQIELATNNDVLLKNSSCSWLFMIGSEDVLHDPSSTAKYWQNTVPGSQAKIIKNAGRLLAFTHSEIIADALSKLRTT